MHYWTSQQLPKFSKEDSPFPVNSQNEIEPVIVQEGFCISCPNRVAKKPNIQEDLWPHLMPVLCKSKAFLQWGALGVLVDEDADGVRLPIYEYAWRMFDVSLTKPQKDELSNFFKNIKANESNYLLLGHTAQRLFEERITHAEEGVYSVECASELPCLALVSTEFLPLFNNYIENSPTCTGETLRIKTWQDAPEDPFIEFNDNDRKKWKKYVTDVGNKVGAADSVLFFIPAVTLNSRGDICFAGGAIWCTKADEKSVEAALDYLSSAQLYLRWVLGEAIKSYPKFGMPKNLWSRWTRDIKTLVFSRPFSSEDVQPNHEYLETGELHEHLCEVVRVLTIHNDEQSKLIDKAIISDENIGKLFNKNYHDLHETLKAMLFNPTRITASLAVFFKLLWLNLCGEGSIESESMPNSKIRFTDLFAGNASDADGPSVWLLLFNLVRLFIAAKNNNQTIQLTCEDMGNKAIIKIKLKGKRRKLPKKMNFKALDDTSVDTDERGLLSKEHIQAWSWIRHNVKIKMQNIDQTDDLSDGVYAFKNQLAIVFNEY